MSFSAIISADYLSDAIDSVSALVDECKLHLDEDGLEVTAVDPANVAMVNMEARTTTFESYEADGGVIGVDLEPIEDALSLADSGELVYLDLDEETNKLDVRIGGLEYTLALIDPDSIRQEPDIPDLDLLGTFILEGKDIDTAVKAADLCSDHIAIDADVDEEELIFSAEGDTDDVEYTFGNEDLIDANVDEDCHSLFSLDYLKDMKKAIPNGAEASLVVGDEQPAKIRYSVAEGNVKVEYMLAPRVQT